MKVGNKIKEIRKEKGITQSELAKSLKVSPAAISQFEQKENLKLETIKKIADALQVPLQCFLDIDNLDQTIDFEKKSQIYNKGLTDIYNRLKKLGFFIGVDLTKNVNKNQDNYLITCPDKSFIQVTIEELKQLEKDSDYYLKFKLMELKEEKQLF